MEKNKGFTLIELLVTIAILSIVLTGVTTIMVTGSKSFTKGNADANMQSQAQLIVNQIEDMVIDTNGGVDYIDNGGSREFVLYNAFEAEDGSGTNYIKEMVKWVGADKTLVYSKWDVTYNTTSNTYEVIEPAEVTDALFAEDVADFSIDLSDTRKEYNKSGEEIDVVQSVQITVGCTGNGGQVSYATSPVITLRNRLMLSADPEMIFDNTPTSSDTLKLYISGASEGAAARKPIQDRVTEVERNQMYNIYAMINAENDVNSLVEWKIEESGSTSIINESGHLQVGEYESNPYLTIVATYKNNPGKNAKGVVRVVGGSGKSLDSVEIIPKELKSFAPKYYSIVSSTNFTEDELSQLSYKWIISEPKRAESFTDTNSTLELQFIRKKENYGKPILITLAVSSNITGQTVTDTIVYVIDSEGTPSDSDSYMKRGVVSSTYSYRYAISGIIGSYSFDTDYYFCDEYGNKRLDCEQYKSFIKVTPWDSSFGFDILPGLPLDQTFYVKVFADYLGEQDTSFHYERILCIPETKIYGQVVNNPQNDFYGEYEIVYSLTGYLKEAWKENPSVIYTIAPEDFVYEAPEGTVITATITDRYTKTGESLMGAKVTLSSNGNKEDVELKSLKVKIGLSDYPEIYTYSTINFGQ